MAVILDLISAVVFAGAIVLLGLRLSATVQATALATNTSGMIMEQMVEVTHLMESDFKKVGFGLDDPTSAVAVADSTRIRFRGDLNRDGVADSVEWYLGKRLTQYTDRDVRILCRRYNGRSDTVAALGVTTFKLRYLDKNGVATTLPASVAMIEMTLALSSLYKVADAVNPDSLVYVTALTRHGLVSTRNLSRHG